MSHDNDNVEPTDARVENDILTVVLSDGTSLTSPISKYPRLFSASEDQLSRLELSPFGVHWPDLDEDLSVDGLRRAVGNS
jgi:hypothetical protein